MAVVVQWTSPVCHGSPAGCVQRDSPVRLGSAVGSVQWVSAVVVVHIEPHPVNALVVERQRAKELTNPCAVCLSVMVADRPSRASRPTRARQPAANKIETSVESYPSHRARPRRQTYRRAWSIAEAMRLAPAMTEVAVHAQPTSRAMCEAGASMGLRTSGGPSR